MSWLPGGGGGSAAVGHAALAVEAGQAGPWSCTAACARASSTASARVPAAGAPRAERPPALRRSKGPLDTAAAFTMPFGMLSPPITYAMVMQRHMHRFGTTSEHLGNVAVRFRDHATRNPRAVMRQPMTLDDYFASRLVAEPFHLFDCCMENDGACAVVVTSARAGGRRWPGRWSRSWPPPRARRVPTATAST